MPEEPDFSQQGVSFFVEGHPAPGGSKNAFALKKNGVYTGRVAVTDAGGKRNKEWRYRVRSAANRACMRPFEGPVKLTVIFYMPRPNAHFLKKGLRSNAPYWHVIAPDSTKLLRSTEDAMKMIAWFDDCQVVLQNVRKQYLCKSGLIPSGAQITIQPLTP